MADSASLQARSFGKIVVPTPGTPIRLSSHLGLHVSRIRLAGVIGEVGRVFLGEGLIVAYWTWVPHWNS